MPMPDPSRGVFLANFKNAVTLKTGLGVRQWYGILEFNVPLDTV